MVRKRAKISILRFATIAFLSGACVMVLEMVGARLLAPFLGTSIVVWTSLIGIILASLSVGYWLGGRLADKTVSERVLAWLLLGAAAMIFLTALIHTPVLRWVSQLDSLHTSAVMAAIVLFALPAGFCGMISPYVIRLAMSEVSTAGTTVGTLNAISTAGSILGTFLGGFVLISWVSSPVIIYGIAFVMAATALLTRGRMVLPQLGVLILVAGGGALSTHYDSPLQDGIVYFQETPYNSVRVKEEVRFSEGTQRPVRVLITDEEKTQSASFIDDPAELVFDYTKYYALGTALKPQAERILMLGGGGYSVPKWLLGPASPLQAGSFQLDVVEIDPGVTRAAELFLGLKTDEYANLHVFHEDARRFVNRTAVGNGPRYDLILGDVFNSHASVPFHVGTREAAQSVHDSLAPDGLFLMNIISALDGDDGRLFRSIHGAFAEVFPHTYTFLVQAPHRPFVVQNIILIAAGKPLDLPALEEKSPEIAKLLSHRYVHPIPADVPALADAYAPVERYTLGLIR